MRIEHETLAAVSAVVATNSCTISNVHGFFNGTTANRYLQLHDAKALPADTAVPMRVWPIYMTAPFEITFIGDPIALANGAVFVVSTTRATLTASADTMDIFVNGVQTSDTTGVSVAGDYTTLDEVLQVWADSAGPKRLLRIEYSNVSGGGADYLQVHAGDTPLTNKLVASFPMVAQGSSAVLEFGGGLECRKVIGSTIYDGCTLAVSSAALTYSAVGSADYYLKATYK